MTKLDWWDDARNYAVVAQYMADSGDSIADIIYMLEKPWKFEEEYKKAVKLNPPFRSDG